MHERSTANGNATSGVHFPPPFIYAGVFLAGLLLKRLAPLPAPPRKLSLGLAVLLLVPGFGLLYWSLALFLQKKTSPLPFRPTTTLVTSGPYRWTRNPMYLGLLLVYLGLGFWFEVFWAVLLSPAAIALMGRFIIRKEERYLEGLFGEDYRRYRAQVRRWLGQA